MPDGCDIDEVTQGTSDKRPMPPYGTQCLYLNLLIKFLEKRDSDETVHSSFRENFKEDECENAGDCHDCVLWHFI